jgi:hypothetical protein
LGPPHRDGTRALRIRAELLRDGGPELIERFVDEPPRAGGAVGEDGDGLEGDRAAVRGGAREQVVAAGVQGGGQVVADGDQVDDALLDLGQLDPGPLLEPGVDPLAVPVPTQLEQVGDLVKGEPEPLGGGPLDRMERALANRSSNSARRSGRSALGKVHASTEAHPKSPGPARCRRVHAVNGRPVPLYRMQAQAGSTFDHRPSASQAGAPVPVQLSMTATSAVLC